MAENSNLTWELRCYLPAHDQVTKIAHAGPHASIVQCRRCATGCGRCLRRLRALSPTLPILNVGAKPFRPDPGWETHRFVPGTTVPGLHRILTRLAKELGAEPTEPAAMVRGLQNRRTQSELDRVANWRELAHQAAYCARKLAQLCKVTPRTLERYFSSHFRKSPQSWLQSLRMQRAVELLRAGHNVNETAYSLGYADPSHFSRKFKELHGVSPKLYFGRTLCRIWP